MIKNKKFFVKAAALLLAGTLLVSNIAPANALATTANRLQSLGLDAKAKTPGNSNPLISQKFGADPYALVFGGRVYIYMTNDILEYDASGNVKDNTYGKINKITIISSDDMVNWTDHGEVTVAGPSGAAKWAAHSWAPAVAHKVINGKDKFFLYFANDASNIGVLTADSPIGPWTDPIGKSLINRSVPGVQNVTWCFDPAVLVDDDGTGYLYFGGGIPSTKEEDILNPKTARVIKLGDDMISVVGSATTIDAPALFEDSGIHKYNNKYYYSYCSNFSGTHPVGYPPKGEIAYMMSDSPMGPFTYVGPILKNPGNFFGVGGNNHHTFFEFKGQWYVTYHAQTLAKALGVVKGYRSTHINKVEYTSDGKIIDIKADMAGIAQLSNLLPFQRVEAETIAWQAGITTKTCSTPGSMVESVNGAVTDIHDGDWIAVSDVAFGTEGASSFEANVASTVGGKIEIRMDSTTGDVIGTMNVNSTGSEDTYSLVTCNVSKITGVHDIYFMFKGSSSQNLFNMDYWKFSAGKAVSPSEPEQTIDAAIFNEVFVSSKANTLYYGGTKGSTTSLELELPDTLELVDSLTDKTSSDKVVAVTATYESNDAEVVKVDSKGKITATGVGTTTVMTNIAINDELSTTIETEITVKAPYVKFIKSTNSMKVGSTFKFTAKAYGVNLSDAVWSTTKESIVDIDKKTGKAVAKAKGTDYVVIKIGKITKKVKVVVK